MCLKCHRALPLGLKVGWWRAFLCINDTHVTSPLNLGKCSTLVIFICLKGLFYGFPNLTEQSERWLSSGEGLCLPLHQSELWHIHWKATDLQMCREGVSTAVSSQPYQHHAWDCFLFMWAFFGLCHCWVWMKWGEWGSEWLITSGEGRGGVTGPPEDWQVMLAGPWSVSGSGYWTAWAHYEHLNSGTNHFISREMNEIIKYNGMSKGHRNNSGRRQEIPLLLILAFMSKTSVKS